ncbi:MAG TPA: tetratricopeptide repeat protein, partial [Anaeromyxobacteraceae bacterium]
VFDLRVEDHPRPLQELRRLLTVARAYDHMNAGDLAIEKKDVEGALREYAAAERLAPDSAEMIYWHAVSLVGVGRLEEALPLFARAFRLDPGWRVLTPRLPASGLLPDDAALIRRIVDGGGPAPATKR